MKVTKRKAKGNFLELDLHDTSDWYVNLLRRLMIAEVPTLAIESVEISKNDGILYDEIVGHRLGLIPLTMDTSSYVLPSKEEMESGDYLAQSSCKLTLEVKGPAIVYAKDLKSADPKVKPVFGDMPITKLLEGQELRLIATAVVGKGRVHAKWAAGHAYFKRADLDDSKTDEPGPDGEVKEFILTLESWGQMSTKEIVEQAIEEHNKQLKEFDQLVGQVE